MAAKLLFQLVGEAQSAVNAFKQTTDASKTTTGAVSSTGKTLAGIAGAVATGYAVKKVIDFGKSTVDAAGQAAHANKLVTAEFKNAGDATGQYARHAIDLAESLGRQIGVSPQVIKGAEGILATFHSVSGAAGMQAGIFDRTTKAAADLAAAGFGDMESNAKSLGIALQDPEKGITRLTRSGVNFTAAQKEQIKQMAKSGDVLGAQKIMLSEIENQVGGTAAATAGAGAKMSVAYEEMKVAIGTSLLPAVSKLKGMFTGLFDLVGSNASWLVPIIAAGAAFAAVLFVVAKAVQMTQVAIEGFKLAIGGVKLAWQLLNTSFLASPLGLIIVAIIAVVAALVILYIKVDWFRNFVNAAFAAVVGAAVALWHGLVAAFNAVLSFLIQWGPLILAVITGPFGIALYLIISNWSTLVGFFGAIFSAITGAVVAYVNMWIAVFRTIYGGVSAVFSAVWSFVASILNAIAGAVGGTVRAVGAAFAGVYGAIVSPFQAAWGAVAGVASAIAGAFGGVVGAIASAVAGVYGAIIGPFQSAWSFIQNNILGPLKSAWNGVAHVINSVSISTPAVSILGHEVIPAFHWEPPWRVPTLARGGLMTRTGLIYAHAGEVISPAPASATGRSMDQLVRIDHLEMSDKLDVDIFAKRLAWQLRTAGV